MEILTSSQMEQADSYAINELKIPSILLMENAAIAFADEIEKDLNALSKVCIVCGAGNNGGDGYAVARHLVNRGYFVDVVSINPEKLKGDAKVNFEILKNLPVRIIDDFLHVNYGNYDLIVDAIFGTGLNRKVEGDLEKLILKINTEAIKVYSIDIPSGLSGSTGEIFGEHIRAQKTVTFCRPKIVHVLYPAKAACGDIVVKNISIPDSAVNSTRPDNFLLSGHNVPRIIRRGVNTHKGHFGHTAIIAGSKGKVGAGILTARACISTGSGLTTVVTPKNFINSFHSAVSESMCLDVDSEDVLEVKDLQRVVDFVKDKGCVAIGPGLGTAESTKELVKGIIENSSNKLVIDADGINLLDESTFEKLAFRTVLTPHVGEFCRLCKITKDDLAKDRLNICKNFALKHSVSLVLKSADTIISLPDGRAFVFNEGSPSLAKGGSGDVLTGMIASFISQGYQIEDACKLGVYIHGRTGAFLHSRYNEFYPKASDICDNLWVVMNELL
ncbi:MAG: ADP-dependent NAD(P)H-hydrate dehydratase / NAD(P)H-hydrate epimerase [Deferribacteres bacterium]|nr:ADP-dependent NAD(P)H-hydrate dehydratase / NAD(P)H-hydrate epimerase [Deferribacteres bacterium]